MYITTYDFRGDPAELLLRYCAMIEEVGVHLIQFNVAAKTDEGLHVIDACPDRAARDGWVANALPGLLERHGMPQPDISEGFDAAFGIVDGSALAAAA